MSQKRSRTAYEAESLATDAPYVVFGTPFPSLDSQKRDDGAYVPIHKQEVRDSQGRRRLHGAFTGGWSAGYYNTVGSKAGWTPSTFVSSRQARHQDRPEKLSQQRPEDFMDEEDLADAAEAERIQTADSFAGIGARVNVDDESSLLMDVVRPDRGTMGFSLLKKMGWRDGQGVGPKVRRAVRLQDTTAHSSQVPHPDTHLFAPDDVALMQMTRKLGRSGLGAGGDYQSGRMSAPAYPLAVDLEQTRFDSSGSTEIRGEPTSSVPFRNRKRKVQRTGIGIGVLNDTGSDDENDPYAMGPRISLNRALGTARPKKTSLPARTLAANPVLGAKLSFNSKRPCSTAARCLDGTQPLDGFALATHEAFKVSPHQYKTYPLPVVPPSWTASRQSSQSAVAPAQAGLPKTTPMNPAARAAALGEAQLPGQSVFDFMSAEARERVVAATGKNNLPQARCQVGEGVSEAQHSTDVHQALPQLDTETAVAALQRSRKAGAPYADNESKQIRFRSFLEHVANGRGLLSKPQGMGAAEFAKEVAEFHDCARLFKPVSGFIASRFTPASRPSATNAFIDKGFTPSGALTAEVATPADPAEVAAKMAMYGDITRSSHDFHPSRLVCKRFNVRPPDHVASNNATGGSQNQPNTCEPTSDFEIDIKSQGGSATRQMDVNVRSKSPKATTAPSMHHDEEVSGRTLSDAVDIERPSEKVFSAIFGDSSDES